MNCSESNNVTQHSTEDSRRILRIEKAQDAYFKKAHALASATALFLDDYGQGIEEMVSKEAEDNPRIREHWNEVQSVYQSYRQKQDEFLRAVVEPITGTPDRSIESCQR